MGSCEAKVAISKRNINKVDCSLCQKMLINPMVALLLRLLDKKAKNQ
jgi:hypothetical protein